MEERTLLQRFGYAVKRFVGVKEETKISPMIAYNSGVFLSGGTLYIIGNYFSDFLQYVEGLTPKMAGIVSMVALIFDAVTDPLMGIITDRTRSRQGRHRPYIKWGIVPAAVTYLMMWTSFGLSSSASQRSVMLYYIIIYSLFRGAYTFVSVPHTAMLPDLAPEYSLRTQYNAVKTIVDAIGSYGGFIISVLFFGFTSTESFSPGSRGKFAILGIVLALWYTLPLLYTYYGTKEKSSLDMKLEPFDLGEFISQYTKTFRNRSFRQYFALFVLNTMSTAFVSNSLYHFLRMVARREDLKNMLITVAGVGEVVGFAPAYAMSIKVNKQLPARVFMPLMIVALGLSFFVKSGVPSVLLYAIELLYGLSLAGMASVTSNIFPDVADVDYIITGQKREGVISTFSTFVRKFVSALMSGLTGIILSGFGFNASIPAAQQSATAIFGIRFTYSFLPITFIILGIIAAYRYKMRAEDHALIRRAIDEKTEKGFVTLTDEEKAVLEKVSGQSFDSMWIGQREAVTTD